MDMLEAYGKKFFKDMHLSTILNEFNSSFLHKSREKVTFSESTIQFSLLTFIILLLTFPS